MIATLPDPELTHLSMVFDRYIESITSAAADGDLADQRYSFNSYWFPWQPQTQEEPDPIKRKVAEKDRDKRVNTPGILLFRQRNDPNDLLIVFLVGESPTAGINRIAFLQAWAYRQKLEKNPSLPVCGGAPCAAILGPSFTGSLPSLKRLLNDDSLRPLPPTVVISGTATGIPPPEDPAAATNLASLKPAHFCTTVETETNRQAALETYLGPSLFDSFALLREDETLYGEGEPGTSPRANAGSEPLVLRYPRGLARVRNLSGQLPGLNTLTPQNGRYPELPLDLRDAGQDTIRSFGQQTPVSQEAVLFEIAATLRREHKRYVGIIATDPLDALFLIRSIRALVPNVRIIIFHADQLFARAATTWGLRGIIAVSSYPLVSRNQFYKPTKRPRRTEFPDEGAEGEYNAFRRMFLVSPLPPTGNPGDGVDPWCSQAPRVSSSAIQIDGDYLLDYTDPFAAESRSHNGMTNKPSIWIDVLGQNAWWPAAVLSARSASPLLNGPDPTDHKHTFTVEDVPRIWLAFFWLVLILCACHVLITLLMNVRYYPRLWSRASLRVFGWGFKPELQTRRYRSSSMESLVIAATCLSLGVAARASGLPNPQNGLEFFAALTVAAGAILEALWALWKASRIFCGVLGIAAGVWAFSLGAQLVRIAHPEWHTFAFAGYRTVHLESGTSPIVPVVLLLAAFYLFFWFRRSHLRLGEDRHSTLPKLTTQIHCMEITAPGQVIPKFGAVQLAMAAAIVTCWFLLLEAPEALSTLENLPLYDNIVIVLSTSVVTLLILTAFHFFELWRGLRRLLWQLERSPLRFAFSRLPKDFSWMAVWTGDPRPKLLLPMRALEVLRMIPGGGGEIAAIEQQIASLNDTNRSYQDVYKHVDLLNQQLDTAAVAIAGELSAVWKEGISDTIWCQEEKETRSAGLPENQDMIAREEFLALRFVSFIRYSLWVMRSLLGFLTYGFILVVASLTLYPFEGEHEIGVALIAVFVLIGGFVLTTFAEMDRDPLLSRLSETKPNELSWNFVYRIISFGALPLVTLLASQVPEVGSFLMSWLQPALAAVK